MQKSGFFDVFFAFLCYLRPSAGESSKADNQILFYYLAKHVEGSSVLADEYLSVADEFLTIADLHCLRILNAGRQRVLGSTLHVDCVEDGLVARSIRSVGNDFDTFARYIKTAV